MTSRPLHKICVIFLSVNTTVLGAKLDTNTEFYVHNPKILLPVTSIVQQNQRLRNFSENTYQFVNKLRRKGRSSQKYI